MALSKQEEVEWTENQGSIRYIPVEVRVSYVRYVPNRYPGFLELGSFELLARKLLNTFIQ